MTDKPVIRDLIDALVPAPGEEPPPGVPEARKKAMDFLARREYGHSELVRKLSGTGFDPAVAQAAVDGLHADDLQNDQRFAENFLASRVGKGKGPVRIRAELAERGIDSGTIASVLEAGDIDWRALAHEVRVKKFGPNVPRNFTEKARQMRFLQYRGFESDQVRAAVSGDDD